MNASVEQPTSIDEEPDFPLHESIGALVRLTHRAFAEDLQAHLSRHQVNVGMWYFLRALWEQDGLNQRELSRRVGVSEPTALQQLRKMEAAKLVVRKPSRDDRRKVHIHLTARGRNLRKSLIPYAKEVNQAGLVGLSAAEIKMLKRLLAKIQNNLVARKC